MAILGDGKGGIFGEDTLEEPKNWKTITQQHIKLDTIDFLLANPPFGKNIKVEGKEKLSQYTLTSTIKKNGSIKISETGNVSSLFLERNLQLLRNGGKLAIILPEPYFALNSYKDEINLMIANNNIKWIIDLPQNTFRPHNNAKCCAIILEKGKPQQEFIYMAVAENIGHDHQGRELLDENGNLLDDSMQIIEEIQDRIANHGELSKVYDKELTFKVKASDVINKRIFVPRFYWTKSYTNIRNYAEKNGFMLIKLSELVNAGVIRYFSGHGSPEGKFKGEGEIPYIRVKDIVNWQIYTDVTSMIPESEYDRLYSNNKQLQENDILYVSRGSYRIGSVAIVTDASKKMILTREIFVIRVKPNNDFGITPEYLLYALSHKIVWEQTKNKIFYEPCLPNIGNRWLDIEIPVPKDNSKFEELKTKMNHIINDQLKGFRDSIINLKDEYGSYLI